MARLYYNLIKNNLRSIEDVPAKWREEVRAMLEN